jgi:hypothetical protein
MLSSLHNEVGHFPPLLCSMQPEADRTSRRQKQPREAHDQPIASVVTNFHLLFKSSKARSQSQLDARLLPSKVAADVTQCGRGVLYSTRCDALVHRLATCVARAYTGRS